MDSKSSTSLNYLASAPKIFKYSQSVNYKIILKYYFYSTSNSHLNVNLKRNNQSLNPEGEEEEVTSEAVKILISQFELILEFLYTENHEFMDDFKVAITKTKIETKTLVAKIVIDITNNR